MLSIQFALMKCGEWDFRIPIIRHSGEGISFFFQFYILIMNWNLNFCAIVHLRRSSFFIIAPSKTETCKSALKKTYRAQMKLSRRIFFRFLHAVDSWINYLCEAIRRESYFSVRRKKFKGFFPEKKNHCCSLPINKSNMKSYVSFKHFQWSNWLILLIITSQSFGWSIFGLVYLYFVIYHGNFQQLSAWSSSGGIWIS